MHLYILHQYAPLTFVHVRGIIILAWKYRTLLCNHLPAEHNNLILLLPRKKKLFSFRFRSFCTSVYASYNVAINRETFLQGWQCIAIIDDHMFSPLCISLWLLWIFCVQQNEFKTTTWHFKTCLVGEKIGINVSNHMHGKESSIVQFLAISSYKI